MHGVVPVAVELVAVQLAGFQFLHPLIADFDALFVDTEVKFGLDRESGGCCCALMVSMTTSCEVRGRARQLRLVAENNLCSILFHLDVPGGRWQTVICRPVSVANSASSVFHNRNRDRWTHRHRR